MIAPASTADWLQGLTMAALFGGVATTFARTLRLEEPTFDEGNDPSEPRGSVLVAALDA